jgi:Flp pilus assembly protein TadD
MKQSNTLISAFIRQSAAPAALIAFVMLAYLPATRAGFVWDDEHYVTSNTLLSSVTGLWRIWTEPRALPQFYPLTFTTFWLEYHIWGLRPAGYHWVNILFHGAGSVLLWLCLRKLEVPGAWLAAAIFALHPVQVESVAWVTERKNVLSGFFYWSALLCYLRYSPPKEPAGTSPMTSGDEKSAIWYAGALFFYLCALLSKTVTCSLPVVLLLVYWWKRGSVGIREWRRLLPFFILGMAMGLGTIWVEKHYVGARGQEWNLSASDRILIAGRALWFYAVKLVWPHSLTFIYPRWTIDATAAWQWAFPVAALAILAILWLLRHQLGRAPLAALLGFAGILFPALGFVDVYPMRYSFVADHFQYLASASLIALAVGVAAHGLEKSYLTGKDLLRLRFLSAFSASLIILTLGVLTWKQSGTYTDLHTLWQDTLKKNPDCWMAHNNLGIINLERGKFKEAKENFAAVLRLNPSHWKARYNLGLAEASRGNLAAAMEDFETALEENPDVPEIHTDWGMALARLGKWAEAEEHFRRAIELDPSSWRAHYGYGLVLAQRGQDEQAVQQFQEAVTANPNYPNNHQELAKALSRLGKWDEARPHFTAARALQNAPPQSGP